MERISIEISEMDESETPDINKESGASTKIVEERAAKIICALGITSWVKCVIKSRMT